MISTGEIKKGSTILLEGELMKVLEANHVKMGRGTAIVRLTLYNLRSGSNTTKTFMAGTKFEVARMERKTVQFLYQDGDDFHFMDLETYDQPVVKADVVGDVVNYIRENQEL